MVQETVATLGHVRGRDPLDTSSAKQDEEDSGRDGVSEANGSRPAPSDLRTIVGLAETMYDEKTRRENLRVCIEAEV